MHTKLPDQQLQTDEEKTTKFLPCKKEATTKHHRPPQMKKMVQIKSCTDSRAIEKSNFLGQVEL